MACARTNGQQSHLKARSQTLTSTVEPQRALQLELALQVVGLDGGNQLRRSLQVVGGAEAG